MPTPTNTPLLRTLVLTLFLLLGLPYAIQAQTCTKTWAGPPDGDWFEDMFWAEGVRPGAGDDVCILQGSVLLAHEFEVTIKTLTIGDGSDADIDAEMRVRENAFVGTPLFIITETATINTNGRLNWGNGPIRMPNGGTLTNFGEIILITSLGKVLDDMRIVNRGLTRRDDGRFHLNNGSTFINEALFHWQGGNAIVSDGVGTNTFTNTATGVFEHTDAAQNVNLGHNVTVLNEGLFNAISGDINFDGNTFHTDAVFEAGVDGEISFGSVTNQTTLEAGNHVFNGTITGSPLGTVRITTIEDESAVTAGPDGAVFNLGGTGLTWRDGDVSGIGDGNAPAGPMINTGLMQIVGSSFGDHHLIDGAVLINQGDLLFTGDQIWIEDGSVIQNEANFDWQGNRTVRTNTNGTIINTATGTLQRTSGTGSAQMLAGITFDNAGLFDVQTSTFSLDADGFQRSSVLAVATGASMRFDEGGLHTIEGTITGTIDGTLLFNATMAAEPGGTLNLGGTGLQVGHGDFESPNPVTNTGLLRFVSSSFGEPELKNGTTLINQGTVQHEGDRLNVDDGSIIQNESLWDITSDRDARSNTGGSFINTGTGTIRKSGGSAEANIGELLTLENAGLVECLSGSIDIQGNSTQSNAVLHAAAGADIHFDAGVHTIVGTLTGAPEGDIEILRGLGDGAFVKAAPGAALNMSGTGLRWSGGTFEGPESITNEGLLVIPGAPFGNDPMMTNGMGLLNQGTIEWTGEQLELHAGSHLINEGLIEVTGDFSMFTPDIGIFTNGIQGIFRKTGGSAAFTFLENLTLNNLGLFEVLSGDIDIDANSTQTDAVLMAAAGAEINFDAGIHTFEGTLTGNPDGEVEFNTLNATYVATAGATLNFGGTGLVWRGGTIDSPEPLTNAGLMEIIGGSGDPTIANGSTLINTGTIIWTGDELDLLGGSTLDNRGMIEVTANNSLASDGGGMLLNSGVFKKTGGSAAFVFEANTTLDNLSGGVVSSENGPLSEIEFDGTTFNRPGGIIQGSSRVDIGGAVSFTNEGIFAPGTSAGELRFFGDYDMSAATTELAIELGGLTPETEHDVLDVLGTAALGGSLSVAAINDFAPSEGDTFVILTARDGASGSFTNTSANDRIYGGGGVAYLVQYNANDVTLEAQLLETDYAISKTVDQETVEVGTDVTFTITLDNLGLEDLTEFGAIGNLEVTDLLPTGLTFVSATPSAGSYDENTGAWTLNNLASASSETLTIVATVSEVGPFTNTATLTKNELPDTNAANNSDSATVTGINPPEADVLLEKTVSAEEVTIGEEVTFFVKVNNDGPDGATGIVVEDVLPEGLTFVGATASQGTYDENTGSWTLGDLDLQGSAQLEITVTVDVEGATTNTATIVAANEDDPNLENNSDSATVTGVNPAPPLMVALTPQIDEPIVIPAQGGSLPFELRITNTTDETQVTDVWGEVQGPDTARLKGPRQVTLAPGGTFVRIFTLRVPARANAGTYTTTFSVGTFDVAEASDSFTWDKAEGGGKHSTEGTWELIEGAAEVLPSDYALAQNYPNPFNPATTIGFALPEATQVRLDVIDLLGRVVATLLDEPVAAGQHRVSFDAGHLPSGTYLYRIITPAGSQTRTMLLLK